MPLQLKGKTFQPDPEKLCAALLLGEKFLLSQISSKLNILAKKSREASTASTSESLTPELYSLEPENSSASANSSSAAAAETADESGDQLFEQVKLLYKTALEKPEVKQSLIEKVLQFQQQYQFNSLIESLNLQAKNNSSIGAARHFCEKNIESCVQSALTKAVSASVFEKRLIDQISQTLFDETLKLPSLKELEEAERQRLSVLASDAEPLAPKTIQAISERSFGVLCREQQDDIRFIGTDRLHSCISPVFHGITSGKTIITHIDSVTNAASISNIFTEFENTENIEIYLFGGISANDSTSDASTTSIENFKNVLYELYKIAMKTHATLNICYANIFEKTDSYREFARRNLQTETIGCIFNVEGKALLFEYPNIGIVPYTIIPRATSFQRLANRSPVWITFRQYMKYSPIDLAKVYDGTKLRWNILQERKIQENSLYTIIDKIILRLVKYNLATGISSLDSELIVFLKEQITQKKGDFTKNSDFNPDDPSVFHLLTYIICETYLHSHSSAMNFVPTNEEISEVTKLEESSLVHNLLKGEEIKVWWHVHIINQIVVFLRQKIETTIDKLEVFFSELISELQKINGLHVINDFIRYKKYIHKYETENSSVKAPTDNLLHIIIANMHKPTNLSALIKEWADEKIQEVIKACLIKPLWDDSTINEDLQYKIQLEIIKAFQRTNNQFSNKLLQYLHPDYLNGENLNSLVGKIKIIVRGEFESKFCYCLSSKPNYENFIQKLEKMLTGWLVEESKKIIQQGDLEEKKDIKGKKKISEKDRRPLLATTEEPEEPEKEQIIPSASASTTPTKK